MAGKTVATTRILKSGSSFEAGEGISGQRGTDWRAYCSSAGAPLEIVYNASASWQPCIAHISGYSLSATTQTIRVRAGAGTTIWKTKVPTTATMFEFHFNNPPLWGVEDFSLVCELTASAGASEQAISAEGYAQKIL